MRRGVWFSLAVLAGASLACALFNRRPAVEQLPPVDQTATAIWGTPGCNLRVLVSRGDWQAADGDTLSGLLMLENGGNNECRLHGSPQIQVVDSGGQVLDIRQQAMQTDAEPQAFVLLPRQTASSAFTWTNWCGDTPLGGLTIEATLSGYDGQFSAPLEDEAGMPRSDIPACTAPDQPSTIDVEPLQTAQ